MRRDRTVNGDRRSVAGRWRRGTSMAVLGTLVVSSVFVAVAAETAEAVMVPTPPSAAADDGAGSAVDVDGNRMVVSAPLAPVGVYADAGVVRVYDRTDALSPWTLSATIQAGAALE